MKKVIVCFIACLTGLYTVAQAPKEIENDLYNSFKKIDYWAQRQEKDENLQKANNLFGEKLKSYTTKYAATISYPFTSLVKAGLNISGSDDELFRIYSWDTQTGGTMHMFENVFQYKQGTKTFSILDTTKGDGDYINNYRKVYQFKANDKTYYISVYLVIGSSKEVGNGLNIFSIEGDNLINAKIIKTKSGLHSQLICSYNLFSVLKWKIQPDIDFDAKTKTLQIPLVNTNGTVSHKTISYRFNGQYFEKVN